jgi:hypothetical protein
MITVLRSGLLYKPVYEAKLFQTKARPETIQYSIAHAFVL